MAPPQRTATSVFRQNEYLYFASAGLFVGTVLLSRWLLNDDGAGGDDDDGDDDDDDPSAASKSSFCRVCSGILGGFRRPHRRRHRERGDGGDDHEDGDRYQELPFDEHHPDDPLESYYRRRVRDRLSFHEFPDYGEGRHTIESELADDPDAGKTIRGADDADAAAAAGYGPAGGITTPSASTGTTRRKSNWSHFELPESMVMRCEDDRDPVGLCYPSTFHHQLKRPFNAAGGGGGVSNSSSAASLLRRQTSLEGDYNSNDRGGSLAYSSSASASAASLSQQSLKSMRRVESAQSNGGSSVGNLVGMNGNANNNNNNNNNKGSAAPNNGGTNPPGPGPSSPLSTAAGLPPMPAGTPADPSVTTSGPRTSSSQKQHQQRRLYSRARSLDDRTIFGVYRDEDIGNDSDPAHPLKRPPPPLTAPPHDRTVINSVDTATTSAAAAVAAKAVHSSRKPLSKRSLSQPNLGDDDAASSSMTSIREYDRSLAGVVKRQNLAARAHYNARIMPHKLILVRHGQSAGNVDEKLYSQVPDNAMPLTKLGWEQARAAGKHLKDNVLKDPENVHFIVSPYVRSMETFHGLVSAWCDPAEFKHIPNRDVRLKAWYGRLMLLGLTWHEDPRIREQDFGNYQNPRHILEAKKDRHAFGAFYYRFPHGESASDVFDRISTFLDSLWRSFDMTNARNYVLVTHGISIRVLLTRYFRYTIDQFHLLANSRNGEMTVLTHDGLGRLELSGRYELEVKRDEETREKHVVGCHFHKRLRIIPPEQMRKVRVRISYDDDA